MTWVATAFGIAGGLALAVALARVIFQRTLTTRPVLGGLTVALLPGVLVAIAAGAPLGAALGRQIFRELGLPGSGDVVGVASGVALILALAEIAGGAMGLALGKAVGAYRLWREQDAR